MSWAAYRFINSLLEARGGKAGVIESAYVQSNVTDCEYFASPLILGVSLIINCDIEDYFSSN